MGSWGEAWGPLGRSFRTEFYGVRQSTDTVELDLRCIRPDGDGKVGVTVLGATGSIGVNTLDVLGRHPDCFRVVALTACRNVDRMFLQCREWEPRYAVMSDADAPSGFGSGLGKRVARPKC
jgi:hypothetical protein